VDAVYVALDVEPARVTAGIEGVRALGFLGANVTVPHKRAAWQAADARTAEAELVGAANTLYWEGARLVADNTDADGLRQVLTGEARLRAGDEVVLFGAGGAARAAAVALGRCGATVEVVARRAAPREEVARIVARAGGEARSVERPRLVVNATPLGLAKEPLPERFMALDDDQVALDLVYGPEPTPFLAAARARGAGAIDGIGMLVGQAALSFSRWTNLDPPFDVMQRAAEELVAR
jgi:shikimate dehydrogenase